MSSLIRRIQRMPKRKSIGAVKRMNTLHVGDKIGVTYPVRRKKRVARGRMRRTKPSVFNSLRVRKENLS